jgi:hypothetical protein
MPLFAAVLLAAEQPWKDKKPAEWTDEDAKLVTTRSPWAKAVLPQIRAADGNRGGMSRGGGMGGRRGGIGGGGMGRGGINIGGIPGTGRGSRGGGNGYPGGGRQGPGAERLPPPTLILRWESAAPIREAELKLRETDAPILDDSHYAIAVYGVPSRTVTASKDSLSALKKHAVLKRDGKKDFKPSSVKVLERESGTVVVFFFPRSKEITQADTHVEFDAEIARWALSETFFTQDMQYDGHLEL